MTLPGGFGGVSGVTVRLMSDGELTRLEVLRDLDQRRLTSEAAAQLLGLERRQVFRLLKAYRTAGPAALISKRRGRRSNRRKPEALRKAVLAMIREWYWDFGPTLAARSGARYTGSPLVVRHCGCG
jgi:Winged helix-turn helix